MLHTVHMFYKLDYHYYSAVFNVLKQLSKSNGATFFPEDNNTYRCNLLKDKGITIILKRVEMEDGISYKAIEIIMNPKRLLHENDFVHLTEMKDFDVISKAFSKAFKEIERKFESNRSNRHITFRLHQLDSYKIKRVDFAVNIYSEFSKYYIQLFKRANIPNGFLLYEEFNEISKRKVQPKSSFYIYKKGKSRSNAEPRVTFNCYHKGDHLKKENLPYDEDARHIIRIEVQCRYHMVFRIKKKCKLSELRFSHLTKEMSDSFLHYYYKKTIGYGDYYTLLKAKEVIENKPIRLKTKRELLESLNLISKKRGIWKARKETSDKKEFDRQIKKLHELGVNPVTIPVGWEIDFLPCILDPK